MSNLVRHNLDKTKAMLQQRGQEPEIPIKTLPLLNQKIWGLHPKKLTIIGARTSNGKCLGKGTKVRMFDGSIKSVEDINPGDYLMGQDSSARKVLSIHSGQDNLFKIKQRGGIDYVVNSKHILSLKKTGDVNYSIHSGKITSKRYSKGKVINVSVKDYVSSSKKFKHKHKGYMVGVNYKASNLPIPARLLGIWLGDGTSAKPQITTNDSEIENYIKDYARTCNMFTTEYFNTPKCKSISIVQRVGHG